MSIRSGRVMASSSFSRTGYTVVGVAFFASDWYVSIAALTQAPRFVSSAAAGLTFITYHAPAPAIPSPSSTFASVRVLLRP